MSEEMKAAMTAGFMHGASFNNSSPNIIFGNGNTINIGELKKRKGEGMENVPSAKEMAKAVEKTIAGGFWWGNTGWSVVYRVMQMTGYKGSQADFIREVATWPFATEIQYKCNTDSVGKPLRRGTMTRGLEHWSEDGTQKQFVALGQEMMKELTE